jgi:PKD repeat protein
MIERILIALVVSGLLMLTTPHPAVPAHREAIPQTSQAVEARAIWQQPLQATPNGRIPITAPQTQENTLISVSRDVPAQVTAGQAFTIKETLTAKVALDLAAIADTPPAGFTVTSGNPIAFKQALKPGDTLANSYQLKAPTQPGTVTLTGKARAKPSGAESQVVELDTPITILPPNVPPIADFNVLPVNARAGQAVTFDAGTSRDPDGSITDYHWDFGDGTILSGSEKVTVTHLYNQMNTYTVTLTVTDNGGATTTKSVTVTVGPPLSIFEQIGASPALVVAAAVTAGVVLTVIIFNRQITALFCVNFGLFCPADSEAANAPTSTPQTTSSEPSAPSGTLNAYPQVTQTVNRFIAESNLPLSGLSSIERFEQVDALNRTRLVQLMARQALFIDKTQPAGHFIVRTWAQLPIEARNQLNAMVLSYGSPAAFVAAGVSVGDTIVRLTWRTTSGDTFTSFAVIDPQGQLVFDTFMSFVPLSTGATSARAESATSTRSNAPIDLAKALRAPGGALR